MSFIHQPAKVGHLTSLFRMNGVHLFSLCLFSLLLSDIVFISVRNSFVILYVMARDEDEGENGRVSYRIQAGNSAGRFSLNPNTGKTPLGET